MNFNFLDCHENFKLETFHVPSVVTTTPSAPLFSPAAFPRDCFRASGAELSEVAKPAVEATVALALEFAWAGFLKIGQNKGSVKRVWGAIVLYF